LDEWFEMLTVEDIAQETFISLSGTATIPGDAQFYMALPYRSQHRQKNSARFWRDPAVSEAAFRSNDEDDETWVKKHEPIADETPKLHCCEGDRCCGQRTALMALPDDLQQY
jgi:RNA polymerase sigma-70 factor (ECF subfamily)